MVRVPFYLPPLDDRKLGLPSDYLLRHHPPPTPPSAAVPHHRHRSSSSSSFSEDFFRHLSLLKQSRRLSQLMPSVPLQTIRPPVRSAHQMQIQGKVSHFDHLHHHQQLLSPAQIQAASSAENRKRVLRRKHQDNILASQFRFGSNGGPHEVSGGTGVFHPRVSQFSTSTTSALEAQRKQGLRRSEETRAIQQWNYPMERVGLGKGEYYHHQLHSDAGLPQHWTY